MLLVLGPGAPPGPPVQPAGEENRSCRRAVDRAEQRPAYRLLDWMLERATELVAGRHRTSAEAVEAQAQAAALVAQARLLIEQAATLAERGHGKGSPEAEAILAVYDQLAGLEG